MIDYERLSLERREYYKDKEGIAKKIQSIKEQEHAPKSQNQVSRARRFLSSKPA